MDTSAHYALVDANDPDHARAVRHLQSIAHQSYALVTSNFILSEAYTLLRYRLGWGEAQRYVTELRNGSTQVLRVTTVFFAFDSHFSTFCTSSGQAFTDIQFLV